jgi:PAS domain-containing protein
VTKLDALARAINDHDPQLLCFFPDSLPAPIREIAKIKQQAARTVPLVVVSRTADETDIADALLAGARDLVSLGQTERLRSVAERELRAFRLERALNKTLLSVHQYKNQLKAFMAGSVDAIAHVQEGILVDANQAWANLFGHEQPGDLLGSPLMDAFEMASQAALKGALIACAKGHWSGETIRVISRNTDGTTLPIDLQLTAAAVDSVRFSTSGYAVGAWHLIQGDSARARALFERVANSPHWNGFGVIAAEVELVRRK